MEVAWKNRINGVHQIPVHVATIPVASHSDAHPVSTTLVVASGRLDAGQLQARHLDVDANLATDTNLPHASPPVLPMT